MWAKFTCLLPLARRLDCFPHRRHSQEPSALGWRYVAGSKKIKFNCNVCFNFIIILQNNTLYLLVISQQTKSTTYDLVKQVAFARFVCICTVFTETLQSPCHWSDAWSVSQTTNTARSRHQDYQHLRSAGGIHLVCLVRINYRVLFVVSIYFKIRKFYCVTYMPTKSELLPPWTVFKCSI